MRVSAQRSRASWVVLFCLPLRNTDSLYITIFGGTALLTWLRLIQLHIHVSPAGRAKGQFSASSCHWFVVVVVVICLSEADQVTYITFPPIPLTELSHMAVASQMRN